MKLKFSTIYVSTHRDGTIRIKAYRCCTSRICNGSRRVGPRRVKELTTVAAQLPGLNPFTPGAPELINVKVEDGKFSHLKGFPAISFYFAAPEGQRGN